jgi:light-regulated signal transduction histidine kinase (bacteriophytochrome)
VHNNSGGIETALIGCIFQKFRRFHVHKNKGGETGAGVGIALQREGKHEDN